MRIPYGQMAEFENLTPPTGPEPAAQQIESDAAVESETEYSGFDPLDFSEEAMKRDFYLIQAKRAKIFADLPDDALVTVIETNKMIEIIASANRAEGKGLMKFRKLPGNKFLNKETGEVFEGKRTKHRTDSNANLNKSIKDLRRMIENNFEDGEGLFITLTYDGSMLDHDRASRDFDKFIEKFRYRFLAEFIKVIEPKASGSWHFHMLVKAKEGQVLEVSEDMVRKMWGQGSVCVEPITKIAGLAKYLATASKASNSANGEEGEDEIDILSEDKHMISRREFYKAGMRLFSCSQGLKRPTRTRAIKSDVKQKVADRKKIDAKTIEITKRSLSGEYLLNVVSYETYEK